MAHILREYLNAARPAGTAAGKALAHYHVAAIDTEAKVVGELTGRQIWTGKHRPWEKMFGHVNVRSYGPNLKYHLHFDTNFNVTSVQGPPGL